MQRFLLLFPVVQAAVPARVCGALEVAELAAEGLRTLHEVCYMEQPADDLLVLLHAVLESGSVCRKVCALLGNAGLDQVQRM